MVEVKIDMVREEFALIFEYEKKIHIKNMKIKNIFK